MSVKIVTFVDSFRLERGRYVTLWVYTKDGYVQLQIDSTDEGVVIYTDDRKKIIEINEFDD